MKVLKSLLLIIVTAALMMVFIIDKYDLSLKASMFAFISFVLSIVSLVGFNSFTLLNLELYISFSIPIVITIVSSLITYKFDRKKIAIIHDELIENLNSLLEDFEKEKNEKKELRLSSFFIIITNCVYEQR